MTTSLRGLRPLQQGRTADSNRFYYACLLVYLVLEFARPPGLAQLHLQLVIALLAPLPWLLDPARPLTGILIAQIFFVAWCARSVPTAVNTYAAYIVTRGMYATVAISLAISWLLTSRRRLIQTLSVWLLIMAYVALYALTHGGVGPGGFIGDENDVALALCTAFPFAFFGFQFLHDGRRWACAVLTGLFAAAIVATFSRGGFLGFACVGAFCVLNSPRPLRTAGALAAVGAFLLLLVPSDYWSEMRTISDPNDPTRLSRLFLWAKAFSMFIHNPLTGVGAGNFYFRAADYGPAWGEWPDFFFERSWAGTATHSLYFETLAEQGLVGIGVIFYLGIMHLRGTGRALRAVRAIPSAEPTRSELEASVLGLRAAVAGVFAAGAFLSVTYYPYLWYFTALCVAAERTVGSEAHRFLSQSELSPTAVPHWLRKAERQAP